MKQGYVKLYRKLIDSRVFQNDGLLKVWIWCLLKANHEGQWVVIKVGKKNTEVWIDPGQFIFGRYSASKELNMPPSTVWKRIQKLVNDGNLNTNSDTHYTIITIINWGAYQGEKIKGDSKGDHRGTTEEHKQECIRMNKNISADLYDFYLTEIQPKEKSRQRAISNIGHYLKKFPSDDLRAAIQNYRTIIADRVPKYRKDPANFFGKREPAFKDYLPGEFQNNQLTDNKTPEWL